MPSLSGRAIVAHLATVTDKHRAAHDAHAADISAKVEELRKVAEHAPGVYGEVDDVPPAPADG